MQQAWLQVAGLAFDMLGVALIAIEWMLAQRQERRALAIARQGETGDQHLARYRQLGPNAHPDMVRHLERVAEMQQTVARTRLEETRTSFGRRRHTAVYVGLVFIVIGFVLQLTGAWPGCCPAVGIMPGGS